MFLSELIRDGNKLQVIHYLFRRAIISDRRAVFSRSKPTTAHSFGALRALNAYWHRLTSYVSI